MPAEKALLVTIRITSEDDAWELDDAAQELEELASSSGVEVVGNISCIREKPTPNLFVGKGKAEEIALFCREYEAEAVIFSHDLSGTFQRNLEEVIGRKTIDRTQLILDIFSRHANSPEGKMQVELAQLEYLLPRLVGKGILLSRLGGGIGTRGPGEQKLEIDRRRIRKRIEKLKADLRDVRSHRQLLRKRRRENEIPSIALVGYTNAGKSTLINSLTDSAQLVQDSLFTTLDPISKGLRLQNGQQVVISDTVGFLHRLPHHLVEAFKSTLEEVGQADMLVHVLDVSHRRAREHTQAVLAVLKELEADTIPTLTVLNKIDLLDEARLSQLKADFPDSLAISAKFKQNLKELLSRIETRFRPQRITLELVLPHSRMDLVNQIYQQGSVKEVKYLQKGIKIIATLPKIIASNLLQNKEIKKSVRISNNFY